MLEDVRDVECSFNATLRMPMPHHAEISVDDKILTARGLLIDEVQEVGIDERSQRPEMLRAQHLPWENMVAEHIPDQYCTLEDRDDTYWKTLIANRNSRERLPESGMRSAFDAWQQICRLGKYINKAPHNISQVFNNSKPFFLAIAHATYQRILFVTEAKKMGITTRGVQRGDVVCLIYGTNVPFILQKVHVDEDEVENKDKAITYTIVGEAYVHGLMDSEGLRDLQDDKSIEIRIV